MSHTKVTVFTSLQLVCGERAMAEERIRLRLFPLIGTKWS